MKVLMLLVLAAGLAHADSYEIRLSDVEKAALASSQELKANAFLLESAQAAQDQGFTNFLPKLSLNGDDFYNTHVPSFALPGSPESIAFGTNNNWSFNAAVNWELWNSGRDYYLFKSLEADSQSKNADLEAAKRRILLTARLDYFQTQLAAERARLLADSLRLSQSQASDIATRLKDGASTTLDDLSAKNEVLRAREDYRDARSQLAQALRELFALTGLGKDSDPSLPEEASTADNPPSDTEAASMSLKLQSLDDSYDEIKDAASANFDHDLPQIQSLKAQAEKARQMSDSLSSQHWPSVQASATFGEEYPDSVIPQDAQQNTFLVSASWPIFAFGAVNDQVKQTDALAQANEALSAKLETDLERDWLKSRDHLEALTAERALEEESVKDTDTLSSITYSSYQNGNSTLLEVQTVSLRALEAKVNLANTITQMLIELALQSSMSE